MQRRRRAGSRHGGGGGLRNRPMRAAAQVGRRKPGFRQHALDASDMRSFAAMRGASERQFLIAQAEAIGRALLDQRQGLQRLHRGTRKYRRRHVAESENGPAFGIGHGNGAAVPAFDQRPARHFDQNRIFHTERFACSSEVARLRLYRQCSIHGAAEYRHSCTRRGGDHRRDAASARAAAGPRRRSDRRRWRQQRRHRRAGAPLRRSRHRRAAQPWRGDEFRSGARNGRCVYLPACRYNAAGPRRPAHRVRALAPHSGSVLGAVSTCASPAGIPCLRSSPG